MKECIVGWLILGHISFRTVEKVEHKKFPKDEHDFGIRFTRLHHKFETKM